MRARLPPPRVLLPHTYTRRMDGFCFHNADQLGSLAGLSLLTVYVGVVECAPASPTHTPPPHTGFPMIAHLSRLRLFQRHLWSLFWVGVWVWDWVHTPPHKLFHTFLSFSPLIIAGATTSVTIFQAPCVVVQLRSCVQYHIWMFHVVLVYFLLLQEQIKGIIIITGSSVQMSTRVRYREITFTRDILPSMFYAPSWVIDTIRGCNIRVCISRRHKCLRNDLKRNKNQ